MSATNRGAAPALIVLVALVAAGLAGCSGTVDGDAPRGPDAVEAANTPISGGRLLYGLEVDPTGLDPTRNAWDHAGIQLANALYDPLVTYGADGYPQPYLLRALTPGAGYTSWELALRPDLFFTDGSPLDADALLEFIAAMRASVTIGPATQLLTGARKVDRLTVRVTSSRPWASLPVLLAGQGGYVVAPDHTAVVEGHPYPVGTGPFILRRWQTGRRLELVRNPHYWRAGLPRLDAVDFVIVENGTTRLSMVESGELDLTAVTAEADMRALDEILATHDRSARLVATDDVTDAEKTTIVFNTSRPPLDDVRVRRAIGHATDMRAIAEHGRWPADRIAHGPFDPSSPFFSPAPYPSPDVELAKALVGEYLTDRRVPDRPREVAFTLLAPDIWSDLANQLVAQWARAGIRASIVFTDIKLTTRIAVSGAFDAELLRFFPAPDPDVLWHFLVSDTASPRGVSLNLSRLRDPDITAGMNAGRAQPDLDARRAAYAQVQDALARQLPYLWLTRERWRIAAATRVRDAGNVTLPDGGPALGFLTGTHRLTETWIAH